MPLNDLIVVALAAIDGAALAERRENFEQPGGDAKHRDAALYAIACSGRALGLAAIAEGEIVALQNKLAEEKARVRALVHERDAAEDRAAAARRVVELWTRASGILPALGICCDGTSCLAAIGIVGVRQGDAPPAIAVDDPMYAIARAYGWGVITSAEPFTAPDGGTTKVLTFCPKCSTTHKEKTK